MQIHIYCLLYDFPAIITFSRHYHSFPPLSHFLRDSVGMRRLHAKTKKYSTHAQFSGCKVLGIVYGFVFSRTFGQVEDFFRQFEEKASGLPT